MCNCVSHSSILNTLLLCKQKKSYQNTKSINSPHDFNVNVGGNGCAAAHPLFYHFICYRPSSIQGRSKVVKLGGARHYRAKQGGEFSGKFWPFLPKNRGCTCIPGIPCSYDLVIVKNWICLINCTPTN